MTIADGLGGTPAVEDRPDSSPSRANVGTGSACRILLVDDSPVFLSAVQGFLASCEWIEVVGLATSGQEAVEGAGRLRPDLILMDFSMPIMDGAEACRRIATGPAAPPIVIMTLNDRPPYREAAERAGAAGFLSKTRLGEDLPPLIRRLVPNLGDPEGLDS